MPDLRDLYQELILEHSKAPRNYRELTTPDRKAEGYNPLCGDRFTVYLKMQGESIQDIGFQGSGCAISKASASMMTQSLKGKTRSEANDLFNRFHKVVTGQAAKNGNQADLGKLAGGVYYYEGRANATNLVSTYRSMKDHGRFELARPR